MKKDNNPARRLHSILAEAKQQPDKWSVRKVWATVFQVDDSNLPRIFYHLVLLQDVLNEVEHEVRALDVDHDIYLQHVTKIRQVLALPNFDVNWSQGKALLSEAALLSLEFCAERLSKVSGEGDAPVDELNAIKFEIDALFEQIANSNLKPKLRALLLEMLEAMRRAISEYRIRGVKGLREELFTILERFQRNFELISENKQEPHVGVFMQLLMKYDTLTSVYINTPQIVAGLQKLLPGIGS